MNNLVDFIPSGSFALYKSIESIIGLPPDSTQCTKSQWGFLICTIVVCSGLVFVTTLYPTDKRRLQGVGSRSLDGTVEIPLNIRLSTLAVRSCLAVIAFLGLTLTMTDVMGCVFGSYDPVVARVLPVLVSSVCAAAEHVLSRGFM